MLLKAAVAAAAATILLAGYSVLAETTRTLLESSEGGAALQSTGVKYYKECAALGLGRESCDVLVDEMKLWKTAIEGHPAMIAKMQKAGCLRVGRRGLKAAKAASSKAVRKIAARLSRDPEAMARFKSISAQLDSGICERPQRLVKRQVSRTGRDSQQGASTSNDGPDLEMGVVPAGQEPSKAGELQHQSSSLMKPANSGSRWSSWMRQLRLKSPAGPYRDDAEQKVVVELSGQERRELAAPSGKNDQEHYYASKYVGFKLVGVELAVEGVDSALARLIMLVENPGEPCEMGDFNTLVSRYQLAREVRMEENPTASHAERLENAQRADSREREIELGRMRMQRELDEYDIRERQRIQQEGYQGGMVVRNNGRSRLGVCCSDLGVCCSDLGDALAALAAAVFKGSVVLMILSIPVLMGILFGAAAFDATHLMAVSGIGIGSAVGGLLLAGAMKCCCLPQTDRWDVDLWWLCRNRPNSN